MPTRQEREAREARERLQTYAARQQVHERRTRRRRIDNIVAALGVLVLVGLAATAQVLFVTAGPGAPTPEPSASATDEPATGENVGEIPDPSLAEDRMWTGTLTINDVPLGYELDGSAAPQAVAVWIDEVQTDYFTGKTCHRLAQSEGFGVLQCGSIDGAGGSDPEFSFGPIENAPDGDLYPAGTIAMARASGDAYSNGHQFFITTTDTTIPSDAAGGYTVIGSVTTGLEALLAGPVAGGIADGATDGAPVTPTTITGATIQ